MAKYVDIESLEEFIKKLRSPCGCDYQCSCGYYTGLEIADKLTQMIKGSNMGIEIITRGKHPSERSTQETCTLCGTVMRMQQKDCIRKRLS